MLALLKEKLEAARREEEAAFVRWHQMIGARMVLEDIVAWLRSKEPVEVTVLPPKND